MIDKKFARYSHLAAVLTTLKSGAKRTQGLFVTLTEIPLVGAGSFAARRHLKA